jgi:hypothetical protein
MTTFTWNLEFKGQIKDALGNDAIVLHYQITGNDGQHTVTFPTSCPFEPTGDLANVAYEDLTDEILLAWAKEQPNAATIQANIESSLAALK